VALGIAACGGGSNKKPATRTGGAPTIQQSGAGSTANDDPCALLTDAEVRDGLGAPFKPPKRNDSPAGGAVQVCTWFPLNASLPVRYVQVSVANFAGGGRAVFDAGKRATPAARDAAGIGDAAYSSKLGSVTKITSLTGDTVISVTSPDEATATKLAKAVLGRV
jgi:hypothetical protein